MPESLADAPGHEQRRSWRGQRWRHLHHCVSFPAHFYCAARNQKLPKKNNCFRNLLPFFLLLPIYHRKKVFRLDGPVFRTQPRLHHNAFLGWNAGAALQVRADHGPRARPQFWRKPRFVGRWHSRRVSIALSQQSQSPSLHYCFLPVDVKIAVSPGPTAVT